MQSGFQCLFLSNLYLCCNIYCVNWHSAFGTLGYRLDVYIHDYLVKRDLKASAQAFQAEGKVSSDPVGEIIIWAYAEESYTSLVDFLWFSLCWPLDGLSFSYRCSWWFSIWVVVCFLGHIHRKDQWEALRSCCLLYRGWLMREFPSYKIYYSTGPQVSYSDMITSAVPSWNYEVTTESSCQEFLFLAFLLLLHENC